MDQVIRNVFWLMAENGISKLSLDIDSDFEVDAGNHAGIEKHEFVEAFVNDIMQYRSSYIWGDAGHSEDEDIAILGVEAAFTLEDEKVVIETNYAIQHYHEQVILEN